MSQSLQKETFGALRNADAVVFGVEVVGCFGHDRCRRLKGKASWEGSIVALKADENKGQLDHSFIPSRKPAKSRAIVVAPGSRWPIVRGPRFLARPKRAGTSLVLSAPRWLASAAR